MNAYSNLSLSRDLEGIRHTIKKFSLQVFYFQSKGFYFSNMNSELKGFDTDIFEDAMNGLKRTGYNHKTAIEILDRIDQKAYLNAKKDYAEAQHLKHIFESKAEGLSF